MAYFREHYQLWTAFPRSIKLFYISDVFFALSQALWATLFNLHLLQAGFTAEHIGLLQSIAALVMALIAIPIGMAGDRLGQRNFYVYSSLLFSIPYLILPWLHSFLPLVAIWAFQAVVSTFMNVNETALLAGEVRADQRAFMFSFMMINFFLWNTLGVQLAGYLAVRLPPGTLSQYQWPLVLAGVCGIIAGTLRSLLPFRRDRPTGRALQLRPSRTTVLIGLISVLTGGFLGLMQNFNNVVLAERYHFSPQMISTVLTVAGVLGWLGSMAVPWTSRRFGDLRAWVGVVALQGVAIVYLGFAGRAAWFIPGFMLRSVFANMQIPLFSAFSMNVTPEVELATANSFAMVGRNLGMAVVAGGYGAAIAAGNYLLPFALAGLSAICSALIARLFFGTHRRSEPTVRGAQ